VSDQDLPEQKAQEAAAKYAWEYFKYHAAQRQSVFRFYLTLIGVSILAYAYSQRFAADAAAAATQASKIRPLIGVAFVLVSFLFWRLDKRSRHLIKLSETALKDSETRLATLVNDPNIRLMHLGDEKCALYPLSELQTFRQVYGCIFLLIGVIGAFLIVDVFGAVAGVLVTVCYFASLRERFRSGQVRWGRLEEYLNEIKR